MRKKGPASHSSVSHNSDHIGTIVYPWLAETPVRLKEQYEVVTEVVRENSSASDSSASCNSDHTGTIVYPSHEP